jgi:hypothetical protein
MLVHIKASINMFKGSSNTMQNVVLMFTCFYTCIIFFVYLII